MPDVTLEESFKSVEKTVYDITNSLTNICKVVERIRLLSIDPEVFSLTSDIDRETEAINNALGIFWKNDNTFFEVLNKTLSELKTSLNKSKENLEDCRSEVRSRGRFDIKE